MSQTVTVKEKAPCHCIANLKWSLDEWISEPEDENKEDEVKPKRNSDGVTSKAKELYSRKGIDIKKEGKYKKDSKYVIFVYEEEYFPGIIEEVKEQDYKISAMAMSGPLNWKCPNTSDMC